jgi:hypothetical protein
MTSSTLAGSGSDLTPDWFTRVLRDSSALDGGSVTAVELQQVSGGLSTLMMRATLSYDQEADAGPRSVIVKFPHDDAQTFATANAMGLYTHELRFYQEVAPMLEAVSIPTCYLAELDPTSGRFTLVLEDLAAHSAPGDVLSRYGVEQCKQAIDELVRFQAPVWNSARAQALDWLADEARVLGFFDAPPLGLEPFVRRFGPRLDPEHLNVCQRLSPRIGEWVRNWTPPTVIQHGDYRTDNMMFGTRPGAPAVTVLDFQTLRLGPPEVDLGFFLGSALDTDERRRYERDLVAHYHARLLDAGVRGYEFDACWDGYRASTVYAVAMFVGFATQVAPTERGDRFIVDQTRRYAQMGIDLDSATAAGLT